MKKITYFMTGLFLVSMVVSCNESKNITPANYIKEHEQHNLILKILPQFARLPRKYTGAQLDSFYNEEVKKYQLQHYYISSSDSFHYFMVNRPAPSLYEKRIAIAGRFRKDNQGNISQYEESFWTFKMKKDELVRKGQILFNHYIEGEDITQYIPGKKGEEEWIEFPDSKCYYDKKEQKWKIKEQTIIQSFNN